jgi:transposase InsO family protein
VDLVGPWTVTIDKKSGESCQLKAITFIDPATGWFELDSVDDKLSASMACKLENNWLTRYPRPHTIVFDNGSEFKKDFRHLFADYGIKPRVTTVKNPQANGIVERVHQVLSTMLRTQNLDKYNFHLQDAWVSILASVAYAIRILRWVLRQHS